MQHVFYIRVQTSDIPAERRASFLFRDDRNYPVLGTDPDKNRVLVHDDQNRLVWLPLSICRFVKLA